MWNLKYATNELIYKMEIDSQRKQSYGYQSAGGDKLGVDSRYKLLYIKQIKNKVLLYSIGNNIQYPVINHNGKE